MKRSTQLAELKTHVKHNTLHKVTARGGLGRKMGVNRTQKSLRITWVKTTHSSDTIEVRFDDLDLDARSKWFGKGKTSALNALGN